MTSNDQQRLLTYQDPLDPVSQAWAKEGFIMTEFTRVECVSCKVTSFFSAGPPHEVHRKLSPVCPLVHDLDVKDVSRQQKERVRGKYTAESAPESFFCHPQFFELEMRLKTFTMWPPSLQAILPKETMAKAGFFYSGCADKVECYSCGFRFRHWHPDCDPWSQHVLATPTCLHVRMYRENEQRVDDEILCEAVPPPRGTPSCISTEPRLSMEEVQAALDSGYPNSPLLIGRLQASEAKYGQFLKQTFLIHQQNTQILQQEAEVKRNTSQMKQKDHQHRQMLEQERKAHKKARDAYREQKEKDQEKAKMRDLDKQIDLNIEKMQLLSEIAEAYKLREELDKERSQAEQLRAELRRERERAQELDSIRYIEAIRNLTENSARLNEELQLKDKQTTKNKQELSKIKRQYRQIRQEQSITDRKPTQSRQELSEIRRELSRTDDVLERLTQLLCQNGMELSPLDEEPHGEVATPAKDQPHPALPPSPSASPPPSQPAVGAPASVPAAPPTPPPTPPLASPPAYPPGSSPASTPASVPASPTTSSHASSATSPHGSPPASPNSRIEGEAEVPVELLCRICHQEEARALFQPCCHLCCGLRCVECMLGQNCPVCLVKVKSWEMVYTA